MLFSGSLSFNEEVGCPGPTSLCSTRKILIPTFFSGVRRLEVELYFIVDGPGDRLKVPCVTRLRPRYYNGIGSRDPLVMTLL